MIGAVSFMTEWGLNLVPQSCSLALKPLHNAGFQWDFLEIYLFHSWALKEYIYYSGPLMWPERPSRVFLPQRNMASENSSSGHGISHCSLLASGGNDISKKAKHHYLNLHNTEQHTEENLKTTSISCENEL